MSIVNTESLAQMFATLKDRLVLMLEIPYKTRMSLKEATCIEVKAKVNSFELVYEKDGMKHRLSVEPGTLLSKILAAPELLPPSPTKGSFSTLGQLRAIMQEMEHHPDDTSIHVQVVGSEPGGGAWYMSGQFCQIPNFKRGLVMTITHPQLKVLPEINVE